MFYLAVSINLIIYVTAVLLLIDGERWGLGISMIVLAVVISNIILFYYTKKSNRHKVPDFSSECACLNCDCDFCNL